jgi:hypothetical protein
MASLNDRLRRLEARHKPPWEVPIEVRALAKSADRVQALAVDEQPPSYKEDELQYLYQLDLETAAGVATFKRDDPGWSSPEAKETIDLSEQEAFERVTRVANGESLREVYEDEGGDDDSPESA